MAEEPEQEKMSEGAKTMGAIILVFVIGGLVIYFGKQETNQQKENSAMIRNYYNLVTMAADVCPKELKKQTGEQIYGHSDTESDKESYITLKYSGENSAKGGFKNASCRVESAKGGIAELVIDGKNIIKR